MQTIKLFLQIIKYQFLAQIEYPGAYLAGIAGQWAAYGVELFLIFLMVGNFGTLAGWSAPEVVFLFAIWLLTYAIAATFTFNLCRNFGELVVNGTMDESLIRPMPPFLYLVATHINLGYLSHITLTTIALIFSILRLELSWSMAQWGWLIVMIVFGSLITACIMMLCEMPALKTKSRSPFSPLFWETRVFTQYPITIYPEILQFIFSTILPLAFINFYPAQALLGKTDGLGMPVTIWLSPLIALALVVITFMCWKKMSKYYESAGT